MKFTRGFFDSDDISSFKLWTHLPQEKLLNEEIILTSNFIKKSKTEKEMTKRSFFLTPRFIYYKKTLEDPKIRGSLSLKHVRLEYKVPEGHAYPKISSSSEITESLNKRKKQELSSQTEDYDPTVKDLWVIKLIKNMKFSEIYIDNEEEFLAWMKALKPLVIQTDFHLHYDVVKMVGKGSFARVYLIQSRSTGEKFAVKAFSKEFVESQDKGKESLILEIDILKELDHPNIIKFFEIHETENSLYLVMELVKGGEIFDIS